MPETILVVEDEPALQETLAYNLKKEGYTVKTAGDGRVALETARKIKPDLLVLDIMLPELDGFEVARIIRKEMTTPILMLTARVNAQLRRARLLREELSKSASPIAHETLTFGNLVINITRREVTLDEKPLQLKPQEYELLVFFAEHKGQMLSREFILERVWGWDFIGDSRTVDVHVRWLRQKIEKDSAKPERIVTVRGGGYRFEG